MSDLAREREILRRMSFGEYDGDTEYDVDVYLWSPSSRRHLIIPASGGYGVEVSLVSATLNPIQLLTGAVAPIHLRARTGR